MTASPIRHIKARSAADRCDGRHRSHGVRFRWYGRSAGKTHKEAGRNVAAMKWLHNPRNFGLVLKIRIPTADELPRLSDLCFRSKAVWGYDEAFMEACRSELSIDPQDLQMTSIAVAHEDGRPSGVVQVKIIDSQADLLKLFVEPSVLR